MQRVLSNDPNARNMAPPWMVSPKRVKLVSKPDSAETDAVSALQKQVKAVPQLASALGKVFRHQEQSGLSGPFAGPSSVLNKRVTSQRRFATQQYSLTALRDLAHKADASLNDIVLYLCSTAIRRFLKEQNALPSTPLTAGIPVNIRTADDTGTGTAISFIIATLGTDIADPLRRLAAIKASTDNAKAHMQTLPRSTLTQYTALLMAPYMLQLISGLGGRGRPVFNVTISNVPGPREALYFEGAKLEAIYPVSLITHGGALNITCLSYADSLNFGYTGCRDTLPSMQRLAVYTGEALEELEQLLES
jgi:WS/DGAT/MGAT family acyltransferase